MPQRGSVFLDGDVLVEHVMNPKTFYGNTAEKKTGIVSATALTLAMFQAVVGTGTMVNLSNFNDNNTLTGCNATVLNQYIILDFGAVVKLRRWRYFGSNSMNEDGEYKIQIETSSGWQDWKTGIPTRLANWTGMDTVKEVMTQKIKVIATIIDTGVGFSCIGEMEILW